MDKYKTKDKETKAIDKVQEKVSMCCKKVYRVVMWLISVLQGRDQWGKVPLNLRRPCGRVGTRTEPLRPGNRVETGTGNLSILLTW